MNKPSPTIISKACNYKIGTVKTRFDKKKWIVYSDKNNIYKWKKHKGGDPFVVSFIETIHQNLENSHYLNNDNIIADQSTILNKSLPFFFLLKESF